MNKLILILVMVCWTYLSMAQKIAYDEYFSNNNREWSTKKDTKHYMEIKDGEYTFKHFRESGYWCVWDNMFVDVFQDFKISTKIRHTKGENQFAYGLIWGTKDASNTYTFSITGKGSFKIGQYKDGKYSSLDKEWTKTDAIKLEGKTNELTVHKKGTKVYYYINNKLVATDQFKKFFDYKVGFIVYKQTEIAIDELLIYQDQAINLVDNAKKDWEKTNLGSNINSKYKELEPIVSHDGKWLYIARSDHPENTGDKKRSDAWVSKRGSDGKWQPIQNMGAPINNKGYNDVISVSPDNNTLLIANTYNSDGTSNGEGVSITHRTKDGWELPKKIEINDFFNKDQYHSFCLAPNKKVLLMAVDRGVEGYGNLDIYVSFEHGGEFTKPQNIGSDINTPRRDGTPFLAADGKTLYFSSSGYFGYGSSDIYMSRRLDDSWTKWTKPKNLGPQVNTADWDAYYSTTADGESAYMVSYGKDGYGESDIYKLSPPEDAKPEQVWKINGYVFNAKTYEPISANIFYYDKTLEKELGKGSSTPTNGDYQLMIPAQHDYQIYAYQKGFYPDYAYIDHSRLKEETEITQDLYLHPIEKDETIPVQKDEASLNRLRRLLETYPDMKVAINGSKDDVAKIQNFLKEHDIPASRINKKGSTSKETSFTIKELGTETIHKKEENFDPSVNAEELEVGQKFRLSNLYFKADSDEITHNATNNLLELYGFLSKHEHVSIEIGGHTNGLPNNEYCDNLSENRAKSVRAFLINKGIDANRLSSKGYGKRQPIATNETEQGRQRNQRVEVKIVKLN
ncbi:MAG: OmpA family protein [Aureispira sp.]|nr:OmpA family protein [Aureispira sp.]